MRPTLSDTMWTVTQSECWEWNGNRNSYNYGRVFHNRRASMAHRVSYEQFVGPIPEGYEVRHRCDNPPCVNPEHLLTGTHAENMQDKVRRNRQTSGERHGRAKLTRTDVDDIRWVRGLGATNKDIHKAFPWVGFTTITRVSSQSPKSKTWA